jgi:peroxiredoxin
MKTFISISTVLCLFLFSLSTWAASGELKPYKGTLESPQFTLTDIAGQQHSLKDYQGNIVLLQFWATYCTPCRKEMPTMNKLIDKMQGKPFKIVTINMAEPKDAIQQFLNEVPVNFPVLMDSDGSVLSQWKVFAAPANFILDKQGNIIYTLYGAIEWDSDAMVKKLSELSAL